MWRESIKREARGREGREVGEVGRRRGGRDVQRESIKLPSFPSQDLEVRVSHLSQEKGTVEAQLQEVTQVCIIN